jgi:hypothetical protein
MKNSQNVAIMKGAKRILDDAFKAYNKAKTDADKKYYLDVIQTVALSVKIAAGNVESEIKGEAK